jgi:hypothetical protein
VVVKNIVLSIDKRYFKEYLQKDTKAELPLLVVNNSNIHKDKSFYKTFNENEAVATE